jgi:hypothetical protein
MYSERAQGVAYEMRIQRLKCPLLHWGKVGQCAQTGRSSTSASRRFLGWEQSEFTSTYVALLTCALNPQVRTLGLNMPNPTARIALLGCDGTRRGTSRGLVSWLTAVVAETLFR